MGETLGQDRFRRSLVTASGAGSGDPPETAGDRCSAGRTPPPLRADRTPSGQALSQVSTFHVERPVSTRSVGIANTRAGSIATIARRGRDPSVPDEGRRPLRVVRRAAPGRPTPLVLYRLRRLLAHRALLAARSTRRARTLRRSLRRLRRPRPARGTPRPARPALRPRLPPPLGAARRSLPHASPRTPRLAGPATLAALSLTRRVLRAPS